MLTVNGPKVPEPHATEEGKGCIASRVADDNPELGSISCRCFETTDSRKCAQQVAFWSKLKRAGAF